MNNENREKYSSQFSQEGSGSAENIGQDRKQQRNQNTSLDQKEQQGISQQLGSDKKRMADLSDLGAISGRDDAAGGSGDRMEDQNTEQATDRS